MSKSIRKSIVPSLILFQLFVGIAVAQTSPEHNDEQLIRGRNAVHSLTGCYLVDYSYTETESLQPGYSVDRRVYDVNGNKSVKEWIYADTIRESETSTLIKLQHILFASDLDGKVMVGSEMKHTGEEWEYNASFLYDFSGPNVWDVKTLNSGLWTRKVTNLDDGLRYQCASTWNFGRLVGPVVGASVNNAYPEWSCANYAPIPGRETRDMGRRDYQTLERNTRIIAYQSSWLERQANTKIIHQNGVRTPLAKELGKNWYIRLNDSECAGARAFAEPRKPFWAALREVWEEILTGDRSFIEKSANGGVPRFMALGEIEEDYLERDLADPTVRVNAKSEIRRVIGEYRAD